MSTFLRGTLVLMGAVFLSKLFGFVFRIQFVRIAGEEAVGIYTAAYPAFIFFLSLIQLGLPIAVAKITAELYAGKKHLEIQGLMRTIWKLTWISIIIFVPLMYLTIPYVATNLLENGAIGKTLLIGLLTIPIAALSGILKGYFQGLAKVEETAWSQLIEQFFRIGLVTWLLPYVVIQSSPASTAAAAMMMALLAELMSFIYLWYKYKRVKRVTGTPINYPSSPILHVALPSAGSRLFGSFTWFLEPIIFIKALAVAGVGAVAATNLYGMISGVFIPLLLFPAFIPYALSIVLVPAVSDARARSNRGMLQERVSLAMRVSAITGCFAATIFYLHGEHIVRVLFHVTEGEGYMALLAPVFFFYYIQSPLHAILQAMHEAKAAMMNSIYGGLGKLFVMFVLASQPGIEEKGAILAIGFGVCLTSFLHMATLRQKKEAGLGFTFFAIPYLIFILVTILRPVLWPLGEMPWVADSMVTGLIILAGLIVFRQIHVSDIRLLRKLIKKT
ncbi:putative polysaccharide biosynthesis protein [Paenisporosarcina antarctica]|uniref:Polysaccharide biosynthesis protein n=1 Tax=Paenisporosarcina antarctica TaxID=417367 RepID=A0A4P6ZW30_9BACL|nr:oligosaccharide flippase family protein [Paenisporosarcina antarctica]QBP40800.1 polysaccharide biosynthesis protein [Paenisporosarcina antarctica]